MNRLHAHALRPWLTSLLVAWLAGCAIAPGPTTEKRPQTDGAPTEVPADLATLPDPVPRVEPIIQGGPNKPYEVLGQSYVPVTQDLPWREEGLASWYGTKFHGRRTASGEMFSMYGLTAAHRTLPIPSYVRVRNLKTDRAIIVRVNDRGPFHASRVIDLSYAAAVKLGVDKAGQAPVEVTRLTFDDIQRGVWEDPAPDVSVMSVSEPPVIVAEKVLDPALQLPRSTPAARAHTPAQRGFYVQLAALRQREGVDRLQRRVSGELANLWPLLAVFHESSLYKLKIGPYASRPDAEFAAKKAREVLQLTPIVVERR